jgi:hypothetical protein
MKTCSHRPNVSAMLVRYAPIRGIPFPFKDLLPWEEVPLQVLLPSEETLLPGPSPMGGGPVQGPAPVGGGSPSLSRFCSHGKKSRSRACYHGRRSLPGSAPVGGGSRSRSCSCRRRLPFPGPWEEATLSRSCSRGRRLPFPGFAPVQGTAPMGVDFPSRPCFHRRRSRSRSHYLRRKTTGTPANYFSIFSAAYGCRLRVIIRVGNGISFRKNSAE